MSVNLKEGGENYNFIHTNPELKYCISFHEAISQTHNRTSKDYDFATNRKCMDLPNTLSCYFGN